MKAVQATSAPRIGLTGGIGSGKSTVGSFLAAAGAVVLDADAMSRASTATGGAAIPFIAEAFGADYLDAHGAMDRARMRALVFADPSARARLEAIVHPIVLAGIAGRSSAAERAGARLLVLDIPLLVESGRWTSALDAILVVDCSIETQIKRASQRSNLSPAEVQRIIDAQASRTQRCGAADAVLFNDGISLSVLEGKVRAFTQSFGL